MRLGDDEDSAGSGEYVFESAHTFNALIQLCLQEMRRASCGATPGRRGQARGDAEAARSGVERPARLRALEEATQAVARLYLLARSFLRKLSVPR